jgi:hypothetical protein
MAGSVTPVAGALPVQLSYPSGQYADRQRVGLINGDAGTLRFHVVTRWTTSYRAGRVDGCDRQRLTPASIRWQPRIDRRPTLRVKHRARFEAQTMLRKYYTARHCYRRALFGVVLAYVAAVSHVHGAGHDALPAPDTLGGCLVCAFSAAPDGDAALPPAQTLFSDDRSNAPCLVPAGVCGVGQASVLPPHAPRAPPLP